MRITVVPGNRWRGLRGYAALASAATLTAMTAVLAPGSPPAQAALSSHRPSVLTPDTISPNSELYGVSADSATDAWAVGDYAGMSNYSQPLVEHRSGTAWRKVKISVPSGTQTTNLQGVSALSATDAWVAGYYSTAGGSNEPLIEHWNGTTWSRAASHAPSGSQGTELEGVSAGSTTGAWAAGYYYNSNGVGEALIMHCTGTACSQVASPAPRGAKTANLYGVSAVSATDAWAVGNYENSLDEFEPWVLHCNATTCTQVTSTAPSGALATSLDGVSAVSATGAWAAGYDYQGATGVDDPVVLHCTGTACSQVASPAPSGATSTLLFAAGAVSAKNAWTVGYYNDSSGVQEPLTLRCTGTACSQVASPAPSSSAGAQLDGVSAVSTKNAWAVGYYGNSVAGAEETLILHWNGTVWKVVKSPNGA